MHCCTSSIAMANPSVPINLKPNKQQVFGETRDFLVVKTWLYNVEYSSNLIELTNASANLSDENPISFSTTLLKLYSKNMVVNSFESWSWPDDSGWIFRCHAERKCPGRSRKACSRRFVIMQANFVPCGSTRLPSATLHSPSLTLLKARKVTSMTLA